jgi:hypothetical protein
VTSASRPPESVAAYIDGFNLYFDIRQYGRRCLWLDLEALKVRQSQLPDAVAAGDGFFGRPDHWR